MKKWLICLVLGLLFVSVAVTVIAIPNPSATYCENHGYTYNNTDCIFDDNNYCEAWAFYNGGCGEEYVKDLGCAEAGERMSAGIDCCEGLSPIDNSEPTDSGICSAMAGGYSMCSDCGNGLCEEWENSCNCGEDCGIGNHTQGNTTATQGNTTNTVGNQIQSQATVQTMEKTRIQNRTNLTFTPWQKRNESECMEGCSCQGAVVSCITENGKMMTIQAGRSGNVIVITVERVNVSTELEVELENESGNNIAGLRARLSNGETREVKILPDEAAERARERLRIRECSSDNNCSLELNEEAQQLRYEMQVERHSRILGIFQKKMQIRAEVNAENGETSIKKPWWAFIAVEPEE